MIVSVSVCVLSDSLVKCVYAYAYSSYDVIQVYRKLAPAYMNWAIFSRQDSSRCERFYRVERKRETIYSKTFKRRDHMPYQIFTSSKRKYLVL